MGGRGGEVQDSGFRQLRIHRRYVAEGALLHRQVLLGAGNVTAQTYGRFREGKLGQILLSPRKVAGSAAEAVALVFEFQVGYPRFRRLPVNDRSRGAVVASVAE
jgi:hypothetical protein